MNNYSFIVSAGASPVFNSLEVLRLLGFDIEIALISDRKCEALNTANEKGITNFLYHNSDRHSFSQFASEKINLLNTNLTFSLFSKYIDPKFVKNCINIHPGCLSSRPGLNAINNAFENKDDFLVNTAHFINEEFDKGKPKLINIASIKDLSLNEVKRISFLMKTYLITSIIINDIDQNANFRFIDGATFSIKQIIDFRKHFLNVNKDFPVGLFEKVF